MPNRIDSTIQIKQLNSYTDKQDFPAGIDVGAPHLGPKKDTVVVRHTERKDDVSRVALMRAE